MTEALLVTVFVVVHVVLIGVCFGPIIYLAIGCQREIDAIKLLLAERRARDTSHE